MSTSLKELSDLESKNNLNEMENKKFEMTGHKSEDL